MAQNYSISDLSREFEVTPRTLRFYEEKCLLKPKRDGQSRIYSASDRSRLRLILRGKRLGFSLQESQHLIEMYEPRSSNKKQLRAVLDKIRNKRSELEQQMADIKTMQQDLRAWEKRYADALSDNNLIMGLSDNEFC